MFSFLWLVECHTLFTCGLPLLFFQFSCGIVPLILCKCHTKLFHYLIWSYEFCFFYFKHCLCCVDCHTFFLSDWNCLNFLCVNVTQISCLFPLYFCECYTCVVIFVVWISRKYPCVSITSKLILHFGKPILILVWTAATHILLENPTCPNSLLIFGNTANVFITTLGVSAL